MEAVKTNEFSSLITTDNTKARARKKSFTLNMHPDVLVMQITYKPPLSFSFFSTKKPKDFMILLVEG